MCKALKKQRIKYKERATRIELVLDAWEASVLPLNHARISVSILREIVILKRAKCDKTGNSDFWTFGLLEVLYVVIEG